MARKIIYNGESYYCSLAFVMNIIGNKYKSLIIFHLIEGAQRSITLQSTIEGLSNRMFTYSIRALEKDKIVRRIVYPEVPPRVEYELTNLGQTLVPFIKELDNWGKEYATQLNLWVED